MDVNVTAAAAPRHVMDLRPAADAAAAARDPRPEVPVPAVPPAAAATPAVPSGALVSSTLVAAVSRSMLIDLATDGGLPRGADGASPAERTLKPYGVVLLPRTAAAEDEGARPDSSAATRGADGLSGPAQGSTSAAERTPADAAPGAAFPATTPPQASEAAPPAAASSQPPSARPKASAVAPVGGAQPSAQAQPTQPRAGVSTAQAVPPATPSSAPTAAPETASETGPETGPAQPDPSAAMPTAQDPETDRA